VFTLPKKIFTQAPTVVKKDGYFSRYPKRIVMTTYSLPIIFSNS